MKGYLREYGLIVVVILLGIVGYAIVRENKSELLTGSLDTIRNRLVAMVDDVSGREAVARHFDQFQEKVMAHEVPPEEVENIAANVLNLSNSGSTLTPEQAALMLEFASSAAEVTLRPPAAPVEPAALAALADRLESMIAFDVEVHEAMADRQADRQELTQHIRYRVEEGLRIDIDPAMTEAMKQRLASQVDRLEKRKMVVWRRNMAEEIRAERERARYELRSVAALKRRPPREVRVAMKRLESLKHLEVLGYRPMLSDSVKREITIHIEGALAEIGEDLEAVLVDQEDLIEEHLDAVEDILEEVEDQLEELEEEIEEEEEDDDNEQ